MFHSNVYHYSGLHMNSVGYTDLFGIIIEQQQISEYGPVVLE